MTSHHYPNHMSLLFTRQESGGITQAAIMTIALESRAVSHVYSQGNGRQHSPQDRALDLLDAALSRWIEQTKEGQESWSSSCGDLNVGDMANDGLASEPTLAPFLLQQGIEILSLDTLTDACHIEYDRVLASPDVE